MRMTKEELVAKLADNPDLKMSSASGNSGGTIGAGGGMSQREIPSPPLPDLVAALYRESENDFMSWVLEYAKLKRWRVAHFRGAWSKDGKRYMTPVQAEGTGFPDLCLVRDNRLIFAEIKSARGKTSAEQYDWLKALGEVVPVYIWRPQDRPSIEEILR